MAGRMTAIEHAAPLDAGARTRYGWTRLHMRGPP